MASLGWARQDKVIILYLNPRIKHKMSLAPSKIMYWDFTRQLSCRKRQRDSYAKWKANEEAARKRAEEFRKCR